MHWSRVLSSLRCVCDPPLFIGETSATQLVQPPPPPPPPVNTFILPPSQCRRCGRRCPKLVSPSLPSAQHACDVALHNLVCAFVRVHSRVRWVRGRHESRVMKRVVETNARTHPRRRQYKRHCRTRFKYERRLSFQSRSAPAQDFCRAVILSPRESATPCVFARMRMWPRMLPSALFSTETLTRASSPKMDRA